MKTASLTLRALPKSRPLAAPVLLSLCLGLSLASPGLAQKKGKLFPGKAYEKGAIVEITGGVTDSEGNPLANVDVILEGSRRNFKLRKFKRENDHPRSIATQTNERGEYNLRWQWHEYYNHFELSAVVPVRRAGGKNRPEVLAQKDITTRIKNGSPLVASLEIADPSFLFNMRDFISTVDTNDEQRIYNEMGKPDKVETINFPNREEVSWWYFGQGKTYRFLDGAVDQEVDFDPVTKLSDGGR